MSSEKNLCQPVALGVPTYNGGHRLAWLLESVRLRPPWPDEIVVVDDGSPRVAETRVAVDVAAGRGLPVRLVEHGQNRGIAAAWNTATRSASAPIVALANDDVVVSMFWLPALQVVLERSPGVGVVGQSWHAFLPEDVPGLLAGPFSDLSVAPRDPGSKAQDPGRRAKYEDTNPGRVMAPTGQLFAFRRKDFDLIGGFDENYKSFYEESLPGHETVLVRDTRGVRLTTFEQLYDEWAHTSVHVDGKNIVRPIGLECLSATVNRDPSAAFLTVKEQNVMAEGPLEPKDYLVRQRAEQKREGAMRVDGTWKPVAAVVRHVRHNEVLHVRQKAGAVYVTENHSMVLPDGDGFRVVAPSVFSEQDLPRAITVPLPETQTRVDLGLYLRDWDQYREDDQDMWYLGKNNRSEPSENRPSSTVPRWLDLESENGVAFCWLLGFHVAEGSTTIAHSNYEQVMLSVCCNSDMGLIEKAMGIWSKVIGVPARVATSIKDAPSGRSYSPVHNMQVGHKLLALLFRAMCGVGARAKRVPDFIYNAPRACKTAFLDGYAAGDGLEIGSHSGRPEARSTLHVETVSRVLASGLAVLLGSLDRRFSLQYREKTTSYAIRTVQQFVGHRDTKVVEPTGDTCMHVYDLEIADTHVFCAGVGPVVVHNSDFGTAMASRLKKIGAQVNWPFCWHMWSATFAANPELDAGGRLARSREHYRRKWQVPEGVHEFDHTNPKHLGAIGDVEIHFLRATGTARGILRADGAFVESP